MEVLVLDGKNYVKAAKAASDLGYASDYVGQLCRSGQVDAHLIGRTWYVNQDELGTHRLEKKRMSRVKAREHAKKAISQVHRLKVNETSDSREANIRYERDEHELIPQPRKLEVESVGVKERTTEELDPAEYDSVTRVINEGNKVVMSGELKVVDVNDGALEPDTVILTPRKFRRGAPDIVRRTVTVEEEATEEQHEEVVEEAAPLSFEDKIAQKGLETSVEPSDDEIRESTDDEKETQPEAIWVPSILLCSFVIFFILVLTTATLPATKLLHYTSADPSRLLISYEFSLDEIISLILEKI
jgi:hypothetical protein